MWQERKPRRGVRRRRLKNVQQLTLRKQRESVKNELATLSKVTNCRPKASVRLYVSCS